MYRAVLYISESTSETENDKKEQIEEIKETSIKTNDSHQVTGVLACYENHFFHILEGDPPNITFLINKIQKDSRNKNGAILIDIDHDQRIYSDWELIESCSIKQTELLSQFLQENIDILPTLEQKHHDLVEEFVIKMFS